MRYSPHSENRQANQVQALLTCFQMPPQPSTTVSISTHQPPHTQPYTETTAYSESPVFQFQFPEIDLLSI